MQDRPDDINDDVSPDIQVFKRKVEALKSSYQSKQSQKNIRDMLDREKQTIVIKPENIGNFTNLDQARAYERAMSIIRQVEHIAEKLISIDDRQGADLNYKARGNVLVDGKFIEKNISTTGQCIFHPDTRELIRLDVVEKNSRYFDYTIRYQYYEDEERQVYMVEDGPLNVRGGEVEINFKNGNIKFSPGVARKKTME